MKKIIFFIVITVLLPCCAYSVGMMMGGGIMGCGQSPGTIIVGLAATSDLTSAKSAGDTFIAKLPVEYTGCTVDEINAYMTSYNTGEYVVAGIYQDHDDNGTADKIVQSSPVQGDDANGSHAFTISETAVSGVGSWFIVFHPDSAVSWDYSSGLGATYGTKTIAGSYNATLPATLDVTSLTSGYGVRANATNP